MGALVKSHDAGLAVPDWPTTFGQNMFLYPPSEWTGGVFYEHFHRLVGSFVGLLTVILTFWLAKSESRRWVRYCGYTALALVIVQGVLGGVTVLMQLPPIVSIAHGVMAQTFLILSLVIAYSQSKECYSTSSYNRVTALHPSPLFISAIVVVISIYLQLILGAIMRHSGSGLAIPDFPTMGGNLWPNFEFQTMEYINDYRLGLGLRPATVAQVWISLFHRLGAVIVTVAVVSLYFKIRKLASTVIVKVSSRRLLIILLLQWTLGMYTIWLVKDPIITSLHVVVGATLLAFSTLLTLRINYQETS